MQDSQSSTTTTFTTPNNTNSNDINSNTNTKYSIEAFLESSPHPTLIDITSLLNYSEPLCYEILSNPSNLQNYTFTNHFIKNPIKELKTNLLNKIISVKGTVTKVSQVRPELLVGVFNCSTCKALSKPIEQNFNYTLPPICENRLCSNRQNFELNDKFSTFVNFQKVSLQESLEDNNSMSSDIPRSLDVILREDMVDTVKPGQKIIFIGELILLPDVAQLMMPQNKSVPSLTGFNNMNNDIKKKRSVNFRDLNFKIGFLAYNFNILLNSDNLNNTTSSNINSILSLDVNTEIINKMKSTENLYEKLADSIFPSITGHSSIKKAILLQLIGGVQYNKNNTDKTSTSNNTSARNTNLRVRGDINILLVGDPGTAKSQFLKQASCILQGSVYTSGKSVSSAGLTAAVVREGSEFTIEAGALILADNSLCCIDEFDKMDVKDRVSIHEAMEQQTITINKAEIQCTLNARASVLAAANPVGGRYNKAKSLKQNINLSQPIMSRFDLYFVLIDEPYLENDKIIAQQIIKNHITNTEVTFTLKECIEYINFVKNFTPKLTPETSLLLKDKFVSLRQESLLKKSNYQVSVRHLESLIRLSESLAKLHCDDFVRPEYVEEAIRLLKSSVIDIKTNFSIKLNNLDSESISNDKFMRILNCFIYIIKTEGKMNAEELVMYYLENITENLMLDSYEVEKNVAEEVLKYLCEKEGVLIRSDENEIYVHPNYDI